MEKVKISVIIPIYKVERYLARCVDSVLNQTYSDLEIFLVDDGSPDNCPKMCDEYAKKDDRIKVIHKANGGLSDARNAALDKITGQYVTFVDSDDLIATDFIERLLSISVKYDCDMVSCGFLLFKSEEEIQPFTQKEKFVFLTKEQAMEKTFRTSDNEVITSCAKLFKSSLFANVRFPKGHVHEDEYSCCDILNNANKVVITNAKLYYYFQSTGSITTSGYGLKRLDYLYAIWHRVQTFKDYCPYLYDDISMHFVYMCIALYYEIPKDFKYKKQAKKQTKRYFNTAYKNIKGIKTPSRKRFLIFKFCPFLYKRLFV